MTEPWPMVAAAGRQGRRSSTPSSGAPSTGASSAFEEGLHYVHVHVHTSDGLVQCTCGLICRDESELRRSDGHRNMTTWEIDGVVILRVGRLGQGRPEHAVDVAKCQRCGLAGPVQELGAAKFWRANHQCRFTAPEPYGTGTASLVSAP